jgi:hypothetical protein
MNALAYVTAATLILAWNPIAPANVGPVRSEKPEVKNDRVTALVVIKTEVLKGEDRTVKAKIIIPKKFVQAGREGADRPAAAPAAGGAAAPRANEQGSLPMGTIIAGLALSLAAVSAVFVFRGNRSTKTVALAVLAGAVVLGVIGVAQADLAPPGGGVFPGRPAPPTEIVIELADDGDTVTLLLAK